MIFDKIDQVIIRGLKAASGLNILLWSMSMTGRHVQLKDRIKALVNEEIER
jgi:hypothetical protein